MRATDHRYAGELEKFDLAVRMIGHEARTGTIKSCTGFSDDRIRKIYAAYFRITGTTAVQRRRGKSPTRINRFISSCNRQSEASLLACLFLSCEALALTANGRAQLAGADRVTLGQRLCQAFESYHTLHHQPRLSFEWAWNLYHSLVETHELYFACCELCHGLYVQDAYALDYRRCPLCELKDQPHASRR